MKIHITHIIKVYPTSLGLVPLNQAIATYYNRSLKEWVSSYRESGGMQIGHSVCRPTKESSIEAIKDLHGIQ